MARQPINFKRVGTPGYRTYRVLQARGDWGQIYRERVASYGDLHGAIIFPEQLFTLNQANIYAAASTRTNGAINAAHNSSTAGLTLTITPISNYGVYDAVNGRALTHSDQVLEYEEHNYTKDGVRLLQLADASRGVYGGAPSFGHLQTLFTNKDSAVRWLEKQARENLRKMVP